MPTLPPLNALRAFEAAARHLSFSRAAGELNVTPAAISHQVKALEAHLRVTLFRRFPRSLRLTEVGQALYPELRDIFEHLTRVVQRVNSKDTLGRLTVSAATTFALSWLVPRLWRFHEMHPEIEVSLITSVQTADFNRDEVDVAIRYGRGPWPGLRQDKLGDDVITPLCGKRWRKTLGSPPDLARVPLLGIKGHDHWRTWLRAAGLSDRHFPTTQVFDSSRIAIDAAIAGLGIAIGNPYLHADFISTKRLYQPFDLTVTSDQAYWLVWPEIKTAHPKIVAFREWVIATAATEYVLPSL